MNIKTAIKLIIMGTSGIGTNSNTIQLRNAVIIHTINNMAN